MSELSELITGIYKQTAVENLGRNAAIGAGLGALGGAARYYTMDEKKKRRSSLLNHLVGGGALGAAGGGAISALPSLEGILSTGAGDRKPGWLGSAVTGGAGLLGGGITLNSLLNKFNPEKMNTLNDRLAGIAKMTSMDKIPDWFHSMTKAIGSDPGGVIRLEQGPQGKLTEIFENPVEGFQRKMRELTAAGKGREANKAVMSVFDRNAAAIGPVKRNWRPALGIAASGLGRFAGSRDTLAGNVWRGGADAATGYQIARLMGRSGGKGALLGPLAGLLFDKVRDYGSGSIDNATVGTPFESFGFGD